MPRELVVAGQRIRINTRTDWQLSWKPVTGPSAAPGLVETIVGHYPGAGPNWKPPTDVAAHLRYSHDLYLIGRGYSYGYGFVFGPNPEWWDGNVLVLDVWEVRGVDIRNAANGPNKLGVDNYNPYSTAFQVMCSDGYPPNKHQLLAFRYMLTWADKFYDQHMRLLGHGDVGWTACPGPLTPHLAELAVRITPSPTPSPEPEPEEEELMETIISPNVPGKTASYVVGQIPKRWLPDGGAFKAAQDLIAISGGNPKVHQLSYDQMRALGPIPQGDPRPPKTDVFGWPLDNTGKPMKEAA